MTFKELRKASGMTQKEFAQFFNIPLRSIENWESGSRSCNQYLIDLMQYKLQNEGFLENELSNQAFTDLAEEIEKECGD